MECWHTIFSGEVQGVGFRYTAKYLAQLIDVSGWASNLPNGTVEMIACGAESQNLIKALQEKFECHAETNKIQEDRFSGFEIR